jgi:hypothetical protein
MQGKQVLMAVGKVSVMAHFCEMIDQVIAFEGMASRSFTDIAERLLQAADDLRRQTAVQPTARNHEILDLADRLERIAKTALPDRS